MGSRKRKVVSSRRKRADKLDLDSSSDDDGYLPQKEKRTNEAQISRTSQAAMWPTPAPTRHSSRLASSASKSSIDNRNVVDYNRRESLFFTKIPSEIRVIIYQALYQSLVEEGRLSCVKLGVAWCPDSVAVLLDHEVKKNPEYSDMGDMDGESFVGEDTDDEADADGNEHMGMDESDQRSLLSYNNDILDRNYRWTNPTPLPRALSACKRMWDEAFEEFRVFCRGNSVCRYRFNLNHTLNDHDELGTQSLFRVPLSGATTLMWTDVRTRLRHLPPKNANKNGENGRNFQLRYQLIMQDAILFKALRSSLKENDTIRKLEITLIVWVGDAEILRSWDHHYYPVVDVKQGLFKLAPVLKMLKNLDTLMICRPDFDEIYAEDERIGNECSKRFDEAMLELATRILGNDVIEGMEEVKYAANNWRIDEEQVSYRYIFTRNKGT